MKVAFCDDSPEVQRLLETGMEQVGLELDWDIYGSGKTLLNCVQCGQRYQIYVLDIEMPEINGIDLARQLRQGDRDAVIIFLTGYKEYVYQVFEVLPFRFLQKPLKQDLLIRTLEAATEHIRQMGQIFFFQAGREQLQQPYRNILYFEGAGRKVILHTVVEPVGFYGRLGEIWESLDKGLFTRPHASFLVNMEHIRAVRQDEVAIAGGLSVPVSRRYRNQIRQDHLRFMERRSIT